MDVNSVSKSAQSYGAKASSTDAAQKTSKVSGRTVGEPKLSEAGQKYYEQLKEKYGDMEFVLVSQDKKAEAHANSAAYAAGSKKTVVLIDDEKIEKMATDDAYRKKYEGIIDSAKNQIPQLKKALENVPGVKGFGMQVGDNGTVSFFVAMEKGNKLSTERLEKRAKTKKAEKKQEEKKAEKKKLEKKNAEKLEQKKAEKSTKEALKEDYDKIEASSIEELLDRISEYRFLKRSDEIQTKEESFVGTNIDYSM